MTRFSIFLLVAAMSAPLPALAQAQDQPGPSHVKVNDLDLQRAAGRRAAEDRLRAAANTQCPSDSRDLNATVAARHCRDQVMTQGRGQIAAIAAQREAQARADERARIRAAQRMRHRPIHRAKRHRTRHLVHRHAARATHHEK